jgi:hypothetical protein
MHTVDELVEEAKFLPAPERRRLIHEIEDSLEKAEEKPTTVAPTGPRYARTLALAGTLHSGYRDVASDKYKHLAEIYADKHEKAR